MLDDGALLPYGMSAGAATMRPVIRLDESEMMPSETTTTESATLTSQIEAMGTERARAADALRQAILEGTEQEILEAADVARRHGVGGADLPWELVYAVEARVKTVAALRLALASGSDADIARAWSRASSICPDAVTPDQQRAGREAFGRWGRALRRESRVSRHAR